jgi:probable phosphoglycerate mutase
MRIFLVRHGETPGNATRVIQLPETPLSERGIAQAERLGARLAEHTIGRVVSSDLVRAQMTAECVVAATGAPLSLDPRLQERNFGDLRGTPYAELEVDPFSPGYVPPGGESWDELHARSDAAWQGVVELAKETSRGNLVVVTHGLVCHSLVHRRLALGPGLDPPAGFANTSVTVIDAEPPWQVELLNCTAHLDVDTAHDASTRSGL